MKSVWRFFSVLLLAAGTVPLLSSGGPGGYGDDPNPGTFIRGAVLDAELHELPERAALSGSAYQNLPPAVSLKKYAPAPGDQTPYGTCVAWAAAYGLRTISESVILNRHETRTITGNVYSPVFVYKSVNDDPSCLSGMQIFAALDLMRDRGAPRMLDAERTADFRKVSLEQYTDSRRYTIADYVTLFRTERPGRGNTGPSHVLAVKKSLSEQKPVIIGMNTPESFVHAVNYWQPRENPHHYYGGHAVVVVGYDDNRYGGAFEVLNSWGKKWGNSGFMWIPYDVFGQWVREGYEIIENLAAWSDTSRFSGHARIMVSGENGGTQAVPAALEAPGRYRAEMPASGAQYRLVLGNTDPAWLYVFSLHTGDGRAGVTRVFPPENSNVVPVLDYEESALALPGEDAWIQAAGGGEEYLILFYAKRELNSTQLRARLEKSSGGIEERIAWAAGGDLIQPDTVAYRDSEINFAVESGNSTGVYALAIELERAAR